jgi:hypothetical protein
VIFSHCSRTFAHQTAGIQVHRQNFWKTPARFQHADSLDDDCGGAAKIFNQNLNQKLAADVKIHTLTTPRQHLSNRQHCTKSMHLSQG